MKTDTGARRLPGLDIDVLTEWVRANVDPHAPTCEAEVIPGGRSNLTYRVTCGDHDWVVRRPPLGHVLQSAHDMSRERRVMSALAGSEVPVPEVVASCEDPDVIGAPFYIMRRVRGRSYRTAEELRSIGADQTSTICADMIRTLARLHSVDPEAVGLGTFGKPEGYLGRQLARWTGQLEKSGERTLTGAVELRDRLTADIPSESRHGIVHGDYRLDNLLVTGDTVAAVIDWEMATLGEPLMDLALLVVYSGLTADGSEVITSAQHAPGYPDAAEIVRLYTNHRGGDVGPLPFCLGMAAYKLGVILEGIHYRYAQGHTVGEGYESVGRLVEPVFDQGLRLMDDWS